MATSQEVSEAKNAEFAAQQTNEQDTTTELPQEVVDVGASTDDSDLEVLRAEVEALRADVQKQKSIAKSAIRDRDLLKQGKNTQGEEDYKLMLQEERQRTERIIEGVKSKSIDASLRTQLTKIGVSSEKLDAAVRLADVADVDFDIEDGVDTLSIERSAAALKKNYPFLFDAKPQGAKAARPAANSSQQDKTINRTQFDSLAAELKMKKIQDGYRIID